MYASNREMVSNMQLIRYIGDNFSGNCAEFGRSMGVDRNAVYRWMSKGYIVQDGILYAKIRDVPVLNGAKANNKGGDE